LLASRRCRFRGQRRNELDSAFNPLRQGGGAPKTFGPFSVDGGNVRAFDDVVANTFNASGQGGSIVLTTPSLPGTVDTPAFAAVSRASDLLPIIRIVSGVGPTKTRPAPSTASANFAFSARKPYPGCTACAPESSAALISVSMLR